VGHAARKHSRADWPTELPFDVSVLDAAKTRVQELRIAFVDDQIAGEPVGVLIDGQMVRRGAGVVNLQDQVALPIAVAR